jgi:two-component system KDP operon response regulator KdpE
VRAIRVLVVDDEKALRDFVRRNLEVRGYSVQVAENGLQAMALFDAAPVDLVVLDVMMPQQDGLETARRIRERSDVPIILLTALGEQSDKVRAFDLGVDDYLTKPFGVGELLGRIKAVLRRSHFQTPDGGEQRLVRGAICADLSKHRVTVHGVDVDLTRTEYNLLVYLMQHAGKSLSHQAILQNVWGPEYGVEAEYLRVYMSRLRQKIEDDPLHPEYLHTEHGVGYRFEA